VIFGVVCPPGDHKYEYGPVPPVTLTLAVASHTPLQLAGAVNATILIAGGSVMIS
jgi:hypothetical protein